MTTEERAVAAGCLDVVADTVLLLTSHGQETRGFVTLYSGLRSWLTRHGSMHELRALRDEASGMRRVLEEASSSKASGDPRLDAAVRSNLAWTVWRVASFMCGQHDASVAVWCRMSLAQARARYEGVKPMFTEGDAEGG